MTDPFSRTALLAVIGVAAASLVVAVVLTIAGDDFTSKRSAGADAYSVSAIGHKGLVRLLEKLDVPVVVSRSDSPERVDGLLIIIEPTVSDAASRDRLKRMIDSSSQTLLVLPKWFGSTERGNPWIEDAHLLPVDEVMAVIDALGVKGVTLGRERGSVDWDLDDGATHPVIREPQLMAGGLEGEVTTSDDHMLLGRLERAGGERYVHVLSDPDVLNNFGLRTPENARFMITLIDALRGHRAVVIDETMHGYAQPPSLVGALLQFPLVLASLQVLVCTLLVVWAAMVRFGPRRASPPPLAPGKDFLIRNTAALLQYGGHHAHALTRYLQLTVAAVRLALHAPALAPAAMTAWLERVRQVRGGMISLVELERAVETADSPVRTVEVADQVFRWRMEMTHGIDSRS
jgi:hypothetical protein